MRIPLLSVMSVLALAGMTAQAAQGTPPTSTPTLDYIQTENELILNYTGTLLQSSDAVNWTKVEGASSPYRVRTGNEKRFFCVTLSDQPGQPLSPGEDGSVTLPGGVPLDFVWIEPGTFIMGSPEDELGRDDDEIQHQVTLTQGYWLGKYEVTQAQYEAIMGKNPSKFQGTDLPVEQVSWDDAMEFCAKLTEIEQEAGILPEGYEYTLPTEAQWEYACRAGTTTAFNNGTNIPTEEQLWKEPCPNLDEVGWYGYNSDEATHPVGQKQPNAWELYDMHGNVWEWCLDRYDDYPTSAVTDPTGPDTDSIPVLRGGSWYDYASGCRSALRYNSNPSSIIDASIGFRVALAQVPPLVPVPCSNFTIPLPGNVDLDIIWIDPGTFMMGSPEDELGAGGDETQHQVTLTRGYWMGKYEVTQAQYETIMGTNPSRFIGADQPVELVSWNDAMLFCGRLTAIEEAAGRLPEGYEYTLPTEAQWEYACRAGTTTAFNNGTNIEAEEQIYGECPNLDPVGWYWCNSESKTHPVGLKQPNDWGLYDMHGNVFEWCLDAKNRYPTTPVVDPVQEDTEPYYAVRGGSYSYYDDGAKNCRSAARNVRLNTSTSLSIGFRVALVPINRNMTIPLAEDVDLDMIWVEPGTFMMGSPEDELGRKSDEYQHQVTLTQGYWLGRYEVTQDQYKAIMGTNPSVNKYGENLPVEHVNWFEAKMFCDKLTDLERAAGRLPEGYEYTLPSEAQWEYACRAGTTTALNSGKNLSDERSCPEMDEVGWYKGDITGGYSRPVGQKVPNAWGFYDMHGNVDEWCSTTDYSYPHKPETDPFVFDGSRNPIVRGGGWFDIAAECRSAYRYKNGPSSSSYRTGFRVALAVSKNIEIPLSENVILNMIRIEPGTFDMGSYENETDRDDDEYRHSVTLTQGYWLGKYEVTQAQYEAVMGSNPSEFIGADLPVEKVSWNDATNFCARLTEIERAAGRLPEGYEYTLPTEAQWEYACRAGTWEPLYDGYIPSSYEWYPGADLAWYDGNSQGTTHPVGQKLPNGWGLYDMYGNVWEWCSDWYGDYPTSAVTDPTGAIFNWARVDRGGGWNSPGKCCRSAARGYGGPDYHLNNVGFRVALTHIRDFTLSLSEDVSLDMLWIDSGKFTMGSPANELGRNSEEVQHDVYLSGYWLGKYEVTQAQFEAVMGWNVSYCRGADLPVESISWQYAMEFCARLTAIEREAGRLPRGYKYTLPTEAQWEYACRAGTTTAFNNGKNIPTEEQKWEEPCPNLDEVGWYMFNANKASHPVGQKMPNAWGLYDMHGNVLEWCSDWYGAYPTSDVTDPQGPIMGTEHIMRGGAWDRTARGSRSAYRDKADLNYSYVSVGFRVALAKSSDFTLQLSEDVSLDMIRVTPGTFWMGSPDNELGRYGDETSHPVTLTQNYWLSKYEVTQEQYEAVMGTNPSAYEFYRCPVESVSWYDALEFCAKVTEIERRAGRLPEGYEYSLPTEAQWEYACRAGTHTALNSGKNLSSEYDECPEMDEVGFYEYNSNGHAVSDGRRDPNLWGFYDMHGNVNEWCFDLYGDYPDSAVTDPTGSDKGINRVHRGGSFDAPARVCRSAYRGYDAPDRGYENVGFRLALVPVR